MMSDEGAVPNVETGLVYAHGLAALATLFISVAFGILASIQLLAPEERRGRALYAANCASCHGPRGNGDGPGAASLVPAASDRCGGGVRAPVLRGRGKTLMADVIVLGSIAFGAAFVLVWLLRPDVRVWLEQPKHRFQGETPRYDRTAGRR